MNVIIFENENGGVSMCIPSGELPIEQVLIKDCPLGAIIVDQNTLPMDDMDFFNSWELHNGQIQINMTKAIAEQQDRLNQLAKNEASQRLANAMIGLSNVPATDVDFAEMLNNHRANISNAKTTQELKTAIIAAMAEIGANKK